MNKLREFLRLESASSVLLLAATAAALLAANSLLSPLYVALLETPLEVRAGSLGIEKPLLLWINDGLMAVFFLLVGLELKREIVAGELASPDRITLPALAAVGGMAAPALVYAALNAGDPVALRGWAIPAATDIAFALGVLASLGSRVPPALKIFLLTLAILDDLGAIVIIAIFYSGSLSLGALAAAAVPIAGLIVLNRRGVRTVSPYLLLGAVLWVAVLKSGVHATLAGVVVAMFLPHRPAPGDDDSPLERLEHDLHPLVAFGILPLFAFANAGVPLAGLAPSALLEPVPLGIALGLVAGKQVGVLGLSLLAVGVGLGRLPQGVRWPHVYGVSCLCGIGFTMSLFIGSLAFEHGGPEYGTLVRAGILAGSIVAAAMGYLVLRLTLPPGPRAVDAAASARGAKAA